MPFKFRLGDKVAHATGPDGEAFVVVARGRFERGTGHVNLYECSHLILATRELLYLEEPELEHWPADPKYAAVA